VIRAAKAADAICLPGVATAMTGELYALLRTHSILGRLMTPPDDSQHESAFARGLDDARAEDGGLLHQLFAVRTLGLTDRLPREGLADYLSGLLIGHELSADTFDTTTQPLVLIGEPALCGRYADALRHFSRKVDAVLDHTAPAGLWALARAAGLVEP
jgi:2-dehydro-3-deoxygalactonokinase